jgi:hypothetical protein
MKDIERSLIALDKYVVKNKWTGYDPYDGLNSEFTRAVSNKNKWLRMFIIQSNLHSPLNVRSVIGIRKGRDIKGSGLFAQAYLKLYQHTKRIEYKKHAENHLDFLRKKSLKKVYSYHCWNGHYFPFQSAGNLHVPEVPDIISTVTCALAFLEHFRITSNGDSLKIAKSSADFLVKKLYINEGTKRFFKYTPDYDPDMIIYNGSSHGCWLLANILEFDDSNNYFQIAKEVMDFIVAKQKPNGAWNYYEKNDKEYPQIDFHQGFILDALHDFIRILKPKALKYRNSLKNGIQFYRNEQFLPDGRCKYRWPRQWPVDMHNQAQGIITFSKVSDLDFAKKIAIWTIRNMQDKIGYFYFRKDEKLMNRIPYMRWSQAWMHLALSTYIEHEKKGF